MFLARNKKQLSENIPTPATKQTYVKVGISNVTKNISWFNYFYAESQNNCISLSCNGAPPTPHLQINLYEIIH